MQQNFVHLRVHTEYALVDSIVRIDPLMKAVAQAGMSAVGVTDFCNLFAVVKCFKSALRHRIKPIIGVDLMMLRAWDEPHLATKLTLLCQNEKGYRTLTQLVSRAYVSGQIQGKPYVHVDWIQAHTEDLILLSGGARGDIGQALLRGANDDAVALAQQWQACFPDRFYLEIQRTGRPDEASYNESLIHVATELKLPLVATNEVCFLTPDEFEAHEARICIHEGQVLSDVKRPKYYSREQYLKSPEAMIALFSDLPEAIQNTVEISRRCTVRLTLGKNYLPQFPVPHDEPIETYLTRRSVEGLARRSSIPDDARARYLERLNHELHVINAMGFAGYFLIVADFIGWARCQDIPVGPGRGSGAGSLVAYALEITDLDPIQYDLLFERFLNPERVSMPDFDIDFCMEGRDRVIEYVAERYGRESVSQIITFGTMTAKAVVRDVGRVLGHPYGFVDSLAKLIPFELGMTLERALVEEPMLKKRYEEEEEVQALFNLALRLEGITRNAGKHAGGVVIAPSALTDFTALYCEEGAHQWVSQLDKDDVESVGLVKFDFLGLRTLTIIHRAQKIANQYRELNGIPKIEMNALLMDDLKTFELLKSCETMAVFQVESRGMRDLIRRLQPDCFEDIIALVALFRPGPLQSGMVDDFIDRKHGRATVVYWHPEIEPILKPTYGVILYQEQVMQIAQVLAGYTLGSADLLRRAMGKKKPEEMAKQRAVFIEGATERGIEAEVASTIFDLIEKFAGYGFNKSHSAAYALLSYQTAWLKAHEPAAFMAAVISSDLDHTDKVVTLLEECRRMSLTVIPPSIQTAMYAFTVKDHRTLVYGLGAIKGLGEAAIECILHARATLLPNDGLFEFCRRVDLRRVNRRVFEILIKSGVFDVFGEDRGVLWASLDKAMRYALIHHEDRQYQQTTLLDLWEDDVVKDNYVRDTEVWSLAQRLQGEKETLGFYLTGHPTDPYHEAYKHMITPLHDVQGPAFKKGLICALLTHVRRVNTKSGRVLMILTLEDAVTHLEVLYFPDKNQADTVWTLETIYFIVCEKSLDRYTGQTKLSAQALYTESELCLKTASKLQLTLTPETSLVALKALLKAHPGRCDVIFYYQNAEMRIALTPWSEGISFNETLKLALDDLKVHYNVVYDQKGLWYV